MPHTERCTSIEEIRKKINPQYSGTIGTESFERKFLLDTIDELEAENERFKVMYKGFENQYYRITELEAEVAELKNARVLIDDIIIHQTKKQTAQEICDMIYAEAWPFIESGKDIKEMIKERYL